MVYLHGLFIGLALATICSFAIGRVGGQLSCMDEDGDPVDWSIAYKFPKFKRSSNPLLNTGHAYAYFTSDHVRPSSSSLLADFGGDAESQIFLYRFKELLYDSIGNPRVAIKRSKRRMSQASSSQTSSLGDNPNWSVSSNLISSPESIVMQTLSIAYDQRRGQSINAIFYNDNPPQADPENELKNGGRAHAKGVLLLDQQTGNGVWLTHSVPNFPPNRHEPFQFFGNSERFGQTFMCISFDIYKSGPQIVDHLVNMRPLVYEHSISDTMYNIIPNLRYLPHEEVAKYTKVRTVPTLSQFITTKEGQVLQLFSKSRKFEQDLYSGWLPYELGSSLYTETWRKGQGGILDSDCSSPHYDVYNVLRLKIDEQTSWPYTQDHSKWAITDDETKAFVCLADMNRMESQSRRGGGAVCIKCPACWSVFSNTIEYVEPCEVPQSRVKKESMLDIDFFKKLRKILR